MLHVTTIPAEELKQAEQHRMDSELERVRHEAEIQRRRENILDERAKEARQEIFEGKVRKMKSINNFRKKLLVTLF